MQRNYCPMLITLAVLTTTAACTDKVPTTTQVATATQPAEMQPSAAEYTGTVVETMNTSGYTYVMVDTGSEKIWAAAPEFQVKVGDKVTVPQGMPMKNYNSKTLNRTFDLVYFVSSIKVNGKEQADVQIAAAHSKDVLSKTNDAIPTAMDFSTIKKPQGGKTIAEIYAEKSSLAGKEVLVRGKVVKFNPQIMGKNWLHLQDGTGEKGANDLTITTSATAKLGDTVVVEGVLYQNKDYGYGYKYDVIIEDAKLTIE